MNFKTFQNLKRLAYAYRPGTEDIPLIIKALAVVILFAWFFYRSIIAFFVLIPLAFPIYILQKKEKESKYRKEVGLQFSDAMQSVGTNQKAGYSIENSFIEAVHEMELLYGKKSAIYKELSRISKGLKNNIVLEKLLFQFGVRSGNEDIREFANVFSVAKRSGGNMTQIISKSMEIISEKLDVEKEIDVLISAKKMEARIMEIVPFGIIVYVGLSNPGFFDSLYGNLAGIALMSACLVAYMAAFLMTEKIIRIRI